MARPAQARPARGTGTLALLLILLLGAALMLLYANRALLFEQRSAANQARATQAFEAAEAGREWLIAQLNQRGESDLACVPVPQAGAAATNQSFRARYMTIDPVSGRIDPVAAAEPGCALDRASGWRCACPDGAAAQLNPAASGDSPAFGVRLSAGPRTGLLLASITGCSQVGRGCGGTTRPDATTSVQLMLAALPVLAHPPAATLTSAAGLNLQSGVQVANPDAESGGTTLDSGGTLQLAADVKLLGPPGSPGGSASTIELDPRLRDAGGAPLPDAAQFGGVFALGRTLYRELPNLQRLDCRAGCGASSVDAALANGARLLWIDGDLQVTGAPSWGESQSPLLLIVDGSASFSGPLQLTGLVHARQLSWSNSAATAGTLRGALVATGAMLLGGPLQLQHDAEVLTRLQHAEAALLPVPGSWRDFSD